MEIKKIDFKTIVESLSFCIDLVLTKWPKNKRCAQDLPIISIQIFKNSSV